nr:hypothetical protein [Tanacetum cinerariifolium]
MLMLDILNKRKCLLNNILCFYYGLLSLQVTRAQMTRMMNQEKEATKKSYAVRKEFEAQFNTASASRTFIPPHDPLMPELEDTV